MAEIDKKYHELLDTILQDGYTYSDPNRKGVTRKQIDHYTLYHSFDKGFPAITTKKVYFRGAVGELLSFLSGKNTIQDLHNREVKFWDKDGYNFYKKKCIAENWIPFLSFEEWQAEVLKEVCEWESGVKQRNCSGDLGKIYPYQMRKWNGDIDQLYNLLQTLKTNPMATKKTVTMWNPSDLDESALSPCHWSFEALVSPIDIQRRFYLGEGGDNWENVKLSEREKWCDDNYIPKYGLTIKWHQHSADTFLGLPINILYYSTLCYILSNLCNMKPMGVIGDLSNVHLYDNQIEAAKEQLTRDADKYSRCELKMYYYMLDKYMGSPEDLMSNPSDNWNMKQAFDTMLHNLQVDDFELINYESYPAIKVPMLAYS